MDELALKFSAFDDHLSTLGWEPDHGLVSVLDSGDPKKSSFRLAKSFFLQIYHVLRERLCLQHGGVKPEIGQSLSILGVCIEVIEGITDLKVNANMLCDIVIAMGLDELCKR